MNCLWGEGEEEKRMKAEATSLGMERHRLKPMPFHAESMQIKLALDCYNKSSSAARCTAAWRSFTPSLV